MKLPLPTRILFFSALLLLALLILTKTDAPAHYQPAKSSVVENNSENLVDKKTEPKEEKTMAIIHNPY